jgi:pimeloyl-ACP methyl ester carboxylesterase
LAASTHTAGQQIEVNGASLYVEEQGQGDPLVLIHMGLGSTIGWANVAPLLAAQYRVISFDSRGHGRSTNPSGAFSFEQIADDTASLMDTLGLERPFVGGWSDGGEVTLQLGLRHPGLARALIVGGIAFDYGSEAVGGSEAGRAKMRSLFHIDEDGEVDFDAFAASDLGQGFLPIMRQWQPGGEEQVRTLIQQSATNWMEYGGLTRDQVSRIETPALVVVGDRDESVPVEQAVKLFRSLPAAELAILPGTSHGRPVFDPALFVEAVTDFLRRH